MLDVVLVFQKEKSRLITASGTSQSDRPSTIYS